MLTGSQTGLHKQCSRPIFWSSIQLKSAFSLVMHDKTLLNKLSSMCSSCISACQPLTIFHELCWFVHKSVTEIKVLISDNGSFDNDNGINVDVDVPVPRRHRTQEGTNHTKLTCVTLLPPPSPPFHCPCNFLFVPLWRVPFPFCGLGGHLKAKLQFDTNSCLRGTLNAQTVLMWSMLPIAGVWWKSNTKQLEMG